MTTKAQAEVSATIRAELARRGLKQIALAKALGMPHTSLSKRLSGETDWRLAELLVIAEWFEMDVRDLFPAVTTTSPVP